MTAKQILEAENFKIDKSNLIGYNVKAIMVIAEKCRVLLSFF